MVLVAVAVAVMAKIVSAMQFAAHAKRNTLYGRSYGGKSKFFRLDGLLLFPIIMGLPASCAESSAVFTLHEVIIAGR